MNTSRSSFAQSFFALLSVHAGTLLGGALLPIAMTRILGAEALGVFTAAASLGLLLLAVIDWGYETRLPLLVSAEPLHAARYLAEAQSTKIRLWLIAAILLIAYYGLQSLVLSPAILLQSLHSSFLPLLLYAFWALARGMTGVYTATLRGLQHFGIIARIENSLTVMVHLLAVGVLVLYDAWGQGYFSPSTILCAIVVCLLAGEVVKSLLFMRFLKQNDIKAGNMAAAVGWREIPMLPSHLVFVLLQALSILQSRAGIYTLMALATTIEVGYFSAIARITIALRIVPGTLFFVLVPHFVRSPEPKFLRKVFVIGLVVGIFGSLGLAFLADDIILLLYGAGFVHLAPVLRIAAGLFFLQTLMNILESYILAHNEEFFVSGAMLLILCAFALVCGIIPVKTAEWAAMASLGLEAALVLCYGVKVLLLIGKKKPL